MKKMNSIGCWLVVLLFFWAGRGVIFAQETTVAKPSTNDAEISQVNSTQEPDVSFGFRDPFRSFLPVEEKQTAIREVSVSQEPTEGEKFDYASLQVTGLVWGTDKPKAIINDQVLGVGDVINEAEIRNITKEGILFQYQDKKYLMKREGAGSAKEEEPR